MNDEFFDPLDSELRRRFEAATPSTPGDPDSVLDALRPQMQRARTRHRAAIGGAVAGMVAIVAVAGFALTGGPSNPNNVNTPPATQSEPRPDVTVTTGPVTPTPTVDNHGTDTSTPSGGTAAPGDNNGSNSGSNGSSGSSGNSGDTSNAVPTPQTQTFSSTGGSMTVTLANGSFVLPPGTSPVAGQTACLTKQEATVVEVEFHSNSDCNGSRTSRIRVELVNGAMVSKID
jgi:hypothetical protein